MFCRLLPTSTLVSSMLPIMNHFWTEHKQKGVGEYLNGTVLCSGGGSTSEAEDTPLFVLKVAYIWAPYETVRVLGAGR